LLACRLAAVLGAVLLGLAPGARAASNAVILATTTSTQDSGLLDVLIPAFERRAGYTVKTVAVGTGQALALAARGEADVALVHAPALERQHLAAGTLRNRRLVMASDFVIAGPESDPAGIRGRPTAVDAFARIAAARARFVSRGDKSGTHLLELALWREAGVTPAPPWYIESGQGMGATLVLAADRRAYALTDRATLLAFARRLRLAVLVEDERALVNVYSVMEVNPANGSRVNVAGGKAFADFMVSPEAQALIASFGVERFGRAVFTPRAGTTDQER
jgi:tungstate transport system substrate-binding protein